LVGANHRARAAPVVDDELLPPGFAQLVGDAAGDQVGRAAGRVRYDEPDWAIRIRLGRPYRMHGAAHAESETGGAENALCIHAGSSREDTDGSAAGAAAEKRQPSGWRSAQERCKRAAGVDS